MKNSKISVSYTIVTHYSVMQRINEMKLKTALNNHGRIIKA